MQPSNTPLKSFMDNLLTQNVYEKLQNQEKTGDFEMKHSVVVVVADRASPLIDHLLTKTKIVQGNCIKTENAPYGIISPRSHSVSRWQTGSNRVPLILPPTRRASPKSLKFALNGTTSLPEQFVSKKKSRAIMPCAAWCGLLPITQNNICSFTIAAAKQGVPISGRTVFLHVKKTIRFLSSREEFIKIDQLCKGRGSMREKCDNYKFWPANKIILK